MWRVHKSSSLTHRSNQLGTEIWTYTIIIKHWLRSWKKLKDHLNEYFFIVHKKYSKGKVTQPIWQIKIYNQTSISWVYYYIIPSYNREWDNSVVQLYNSFTFSRCYTEWWRGKEELFLLSPCCLLIPCLSRFFSGRGECSPVWSEVRKLIELIYWK